MDNAQKIYRDNLTYRQSTSAVILDKSGRILIVQKSSYKDNEWDIPGGGIVEGETPRNAIIRELNEELGSDKFEVIKASEQVDRYEWPDEVINKKISENKSVYRGQERVQFLVKFLGEEMDLKIQEEEIRTIKWVFPKDLSIYLIFPNQMQKMETLLNEFGNGQNTKQMTKPKNGSKVLIMSSDKILLFHRDNIPTIPSPNSWQLVGGGIEDEETPELALVREVKEEACYDLIDFKFIAKIKGQLGEDVWVYVAFVEKEEENKFSLGPGEGQEIDWFTVDEALRINLSAGTRILLSKYRKLVEEMMKTRMVPSVKRLRTIPTKINVVN